MSFLSRILLLAAAALSLSPECQADGREPYTYEIVPSDPRSHFEKLSDAEFGSINPPVKFYPYVQDFFPFEPIPEHPYFTTRASRYAVDDEVQLQESILAAQQDPHGRSYTVAHLGSSHNVLGVPVLAAHLPKETDPYVQADILGALFKLRAVELGDLIKPYLESTNKHLRRKAIRLYAIQESADLDYLADRLAKESDDVIRLVGYRQLVERVADTKFDYWTPLWNSTSPDFQAIAVRGAFHFDTTAQRYDEILTLAKVQHPLAKRTLAAALPGPLSGEQTSKIIDILVDDAHPSVREAAVTAIKRIHQDTHIAHLEKLSADSGKGVRRSVGRSLEEFPVMAGFQKLLILTGDESPLIREAALDSLIAIRNRYPVEKGIVAGITHQNMYIRRNTYRVLATFESEMYPAELIKQLAAETDPRNIGRCLRAIAHTHVDEAPELVLNFKDHSSNYVRAGVANAIGVMRDEVGYQALSDLALKDKDTRARQAAIHAIGVSKDPKLTDVILAVLKRSDYRDEKNPEYLTGRDRAIAAWSAGQLPEINEALRKQLVRQITTAVIKTPLGPAFENDDVRTSAGWALAFCAKLHGDASVTKTAKSMMKFLKTEPASGGGGPGIPSSGALRAYGYQAERFFYGEPVELRAVQPTKYRFNFKKLKKRAGS
jgi:HEAT repeat protein